MKSLILILMSWIVFSCSDVDSRKPEVLLRSFVNNSFDQKISPSDLEQYFTGPLLVELKNTPEQKFNELFETRGAKLTSVEVFSRVCEEGVCYLTFSVNYKEEGQVGTSTKKVAKITEISPQNWRIEEISHIKTFHHFKSIIEVIR